MSQLPVRLITMAWGKRYINELFSLTLPALLAPNNLPALVRDFECELVIVTEQAWFERLRQHPVHAQLERYCSVELRPIDDLINRPDAYGMSLTYALFRGFEDLGQAMVDRQLIFFNADFILADGSLRTVGEKILQGESLILAPSYCVVGETVTPWLEARLDRERGHLPVPPRDMAAVALRNRHNTIRGKTVNQRAFSVEWMDQFYWLVDEQTLIGHQLPIAVVSMRPERVLTDMCTFWDYGIISEACPTAPRCVLADSDDFLMIELRSADTARDQLRLGWPEPKEIAGKLKQFITKDPISLARHTLVLHSGDLPQELDAAKAKLDQFVEAVLVELPSEPTHWVNHPIWAYHYPRFHAAREALLGRRPSLANIVPAEPSSDGLLDWRPIAVARRSYYRYFGRAPWLRQLHPYWSDVQPLLNVLERHPAGPTLVVNSTELPLQLFRNLPARYMTVWALGLPAQIDSARQPEPDMREADRLRIEGDPLGCAEMTLNSALDPKKVRMGSVELDMEEISALVRAIRSHEIRVNHEGRLKVWFAASDEGVTKRLHELLCGEPPDSVKAEIQAPQAIQMPPPAPLPPAEKYGLCILELSAADLGRLRDMLKRLTPWMRPGGRIVVFHFSRGELESARTLISQDGLWLDMPCTIHFVGSALSRRAIEKFERAMGGLRAGGLVKRAASCLHLAAACFDALRASRADAAHSRRDPTLFTSFTLEIEVPEPRQSVAIAPDAARAIA